MSRYIVNFKKLCTSYSRYFLRTRVVTSYNHFFLLSIILPHNVITMNSSLDTFWSALLSLSYQQIYTITVKNIQNLFLHLILPLCHKITCCLSSQVGPDMYNIVCLGHKYICSQEKGHSYVQF